MKDLETEDETPFYRIMIGYCYSHLGYDTKAIDVIPNKIEISEFSTTTDYIASGLMLIEIKIRSLETIDFSNDNKELLQVMSKLVDDESTYFETSYKLLEAMYDIFKSRNKKAIEILAEIEEEDFIHDPLFQGKIFHNMGYAYRNQSEFGLALEYYRKSLKIKEKYDNYSEIAETMNHIGVNYALQSENELAIDFFQDILSMEERIGNNLIKLRSLSNLGIMAKRTGEFEKSISYYQDAVKIAEKLNSFLELRKCFINIGNLKLTQNLPSDVIFWLKKAILIKELTQSDKNAASIYNSLGVAHKRLGQFREAESYYKMAIEIISQMDEPLNESIFRSNFANFLSTKGLISDAIREFETVAKIMDRAPDLWTRSEILTDMSQNYVKLNNYQKALELLKQALVIKRGLGSDYRTSTTLYHLIRLEISNNNPKTVQKYFKEFEKIASKSDNQEITSRYNIIQALLLQQSDDLSEQKNASILLQNILDREYVSYELSTSALIAYCEYLLFELSQNNSMSRINTSEALDETVMKLEKLSIDNDSHELHAHTLMIKAKLSLVKSDIKYAVTCLHQVQNISQAQDLKEIGYQANFLEVQIQSFSESDIQEMSASQKISQLELSEYLENLYQAVKQ